MIHEINELGEIMWMEPKGKNCPVNDNPIHVILVQQTIVFGWKQQKKIVMHVGCHLNKTKKMMKVVKDGLVQRYTIFHGLVYPHLNRAMDPRRQPAHTGETKGPGLVSARKITIMKWRWEQISIVVIVIIV